MVFVVGCSGWRREAVDLPVGLPVRGGYEVVLLWEHVPSLLIVGLLFVDAPIARVLKRDEAVRRGVEAGADEARGERGAAGRVEEVEQRVGGDEFRARGRRSVGDWHATQALVDRLQCTLAQITRNHIRQHHKAIIQELGAIGLGEEEFRAVRIAVRTRRVLRSGGSLLRGLGLRMRDRRRGCVRSTRNGGRVGAFGRLLLRGGCWMRARHRLGQWCARLRLATLETSLRRTWLMRKRIRITTRCGSMLLLHDIRVSRRFRNRCLERLLR